VNHWLHATDHMILQQPIKFKLLAKSFQWAH